MTVEVCVTSLWCGLCHMATLGPPFCSHAVGQAFVAGFLSGTGQRHMLTCVIGDAV